MSVVLNDFGCLVVDKRGCHSSEHQEGEEASSPNRLLPLAIHQQPTAPTYQDETVVTMADEIVPFDEAEAAVPFETDMAVGFEDNTADIKLFGKWSLSDVEIKDLSLEDYIGVNGKCATYLPHTAGRYQKKRFRKAQCPVVERLANSLMRKGRNSGKKLMANRIVKHTLEIIHLLTDQNPVQVVVDSIINAGPREDSTRVGSAGVVRRQAVDMSPFRRVNQAIYLITTGARESSFRNIKTIAETLADEIINAAKGSSNSYAIKKKDEVERVAKANR
ncbi:40s ribosomal protein [Nannochloropsis oceanica]